MNYRKCKSKNTTNGKTMRLKHQTDMVSARRYSIISSFFAHTRNASKYYLIIVLCIIGLALLAANKLSTAAADNKSSTIQTVSRKKLTFTLDGQELTAFYTGALLDNRPYGEGIYEFNDANGPWSYSGTLENGVFTNGFMTDYPYVISFADNNSYSKYTGSFTDGQPSGDGTYTIITDKLSTVLTGHFDSEKRFSGQAERMSMTFSYNGMSFSGLYSGTCKDGQADGNGSFSSDGKLFFNYEGIWDQGRIVGPGQLHTNNAPLSINGTRTCGEFTGHIENGSFNGIGTMSVQREDISYVYSGNWLNNVYSGDGKLSVSNAESIGYTYEGSWKNGVYDGDGALIYDSKDIIKYIGNFENGAFRPTFTQLITSLCSAENSKVTIEDYTLQYLDEHQTDFIEHAPTDSQSGFLYEDYAKAQTEENSCCFTVPLTIKQIRKYDTDVLGYPVTEFIGSDKNQHIYYGYYIGYFEDIQSGDTAEIIAYPLGYASYRSQDGSDIYSLRFLAYDVSKRS